MSLSNSSFPGCAYDHGQYFVGPETTALPELVIQREVTNVPSRMTRRADAVEMGVAVNSEFQDNFNLVTSANGNHALASISHEIEDSYAVSLAV